MAQVVKPAIRHLSDVDLSKKITPCHWLQNGVHNNSVPLGLRCGHIFDVAQAQRYKYDNRTQIGQIERINMISIRISS